MRAKARARVAYFEVVEIATQETVHTVLGEENAPPNKVEGALCGLLRKLDLELYYVRELRTKDEPGVRA